MLGLTLLLTIAVALFATSVAVVLPRSFAAVKPFLPGEVRRLKATGVAGLHCALADAP